jgi:hypothetical protein
LNNYKSLENDNPNNINNNPKDEPIDYVYYDRKNTENTYKLANGICKIIQNGIMYFYNQDRSRQMREEHARMYNQLLREYDEFYKKLRY